MNRSTYLVTDIPVLSIEPDPGRATGRLALWMHFLGGDKERVESGLTALAEAGFTAVSFDAWQHGARAIDPPDALMARVFGAFRAEMWPILGRSVIDAMTVVDDARGRFPVERDHFVAGGISMGGDVAVALAGIDPRVSRVAAMIATPDWTRPGMTAIDEPARELDQGEPTAAARWLYERLDPATHLDRFRRGPQITFVVGSEDRHVPPQHATDFRDALVALDPLAAERITIHRVEGADHLGVARDPAAVATAIAALADPWPGG